ncbi:TIR domain-containing protein [Phenylobacterium hankyongense]|nr:TIR domain-containing protein [Phenylobacterium hankyongense]
MVEKPLRGTIFLSHTRQNKDFVEQVLTALDVSNTFYDTKTIAPGQSTIEAMKSAVGTAAVFVLFHSERFKSDWVNFEKDLAEVQRIASPASKVLVCPIDGATYASLPEWMKRFMTATEAFRPNDIARTINYLYRASLAEIDRPPPPHPGREKLKREISLAIMRHTATTGKPLSALVLTGVQGMGRGTLAAELVTEAYRGMRPGGPVFDIAPSGDAVDWHLRLFEDLSGSLSDADAAAQIEAFNGLEATAQAQVLLSSLRHWGDLNQVVTIRHRWGLRDKGHALRPWLAALLEALAAEPSIRLILISERQLPRVQLSAIENVKQFSLEELDDETIQFILTDRIAPRYLDVQRLPSLAAQIKGHPATANYSAYLVNGGRSIESLVINSDPVRAYQDLILAEIFDADVLSIIQKKILKLLSWFPKLSTQMIASVLNEQDRKTLAEELWELNEFSLIDQAESGKYKAPAVVSSTYRRRETDFDQEVFSEISRVLIEQFEHNELDYDLIDSLVVAVVSSGVELSERLLSSLTVARLEPVIEREYFEGIAASRGEDVRLHFQRCSSLAALAMWMPTSDDSLENVLFYGADASVRSGSYPSEMIALMREKGFLSADFIEASYLYHMKRDFEKAARVLSSSLSATGFRLRNVRLLTRIYLRSGQFPLALDTLAKVPEARLLRDTGLVMMKVKALRGTRNRPEAERLLSGLRNAADEYGDYALYQASAGLRAGRYNEALTWIEKARKSPRANQAAISLLQCACEIESGDNSSLATTVALARSMNRDSDALQLQARAALVGGDWRSAEGYITQVKTKDWFDLNINLRVLEAKLADPATLRDPVAIRDAKAAREDLLRQAADAVEGSSFA